MNPRRLFVASCVALIASAFSFITRQDIAPALRATFGFDSQQIGGILGSAFAGMALSMLVGSIICDSLGMKRMLGLAFLFHVVGIGLTIGSPYIVGKESAYTLLWWATFIVGAANGFVEIGINPLAATIYPNDKTHKLNVLHAWWPGGLTIGGLIATYIIGSAIGLNDQGLSTDASKVTLGWQVKVGLVLIPTVIYGFLFLKEPFPVTERVASGVSTREMFSQAFRPMFLLWAFCMLLTASTELAPQGWQNSVLPLTSGVNGTLIVVYTSVLMFVMRHFAGHIAHVLSPVGMLAASSVLSAVGLYMLSNATNPTMAFIAATIYGLGIIYYWPTMLGVTAERFAKGGPFLMGLMGCVGNLAIAVTSPIMGGIFDAETYNRVPADVRPAVMVPRAMEPGEKLVVSVLPEDAKNFVSAPEKVDLGKIGGLAADKQTVVKDALKEGAAKSFRSVSVLPVILFVIFTAIALMDKARGGYKPEDLSALDKPHEAGDY